MLPVTTNSELDGWSKLKYISDLYDFIVERPRDFRSCVIWARIKFENEFTIRPNNWKRIFTGNDCMKKKKRKE